MRQPLAATLGTLAVLLSVEARAAETLVRVSSLGFRPSSRKTVTSLEPGRFTVRRAADGVGVFSAALGAGVADGVSGQTVHLGDFSAVETPGSYYLELDDCARSLTFPIAADVYLEAYKTMMLGFYGQRCGTAVALSAEGASFTHGACHEADVDLSYFDGAGQPATLVGGWHDAGDYGRYTVNGGFTAGFMLRAWEDFSADLANVALAIPESGGATPDFLAETRWQIEWLLAMEYADGSGRFSNAVKSPVFPPLLVTPEADTSPIALASASTMGTAVAAAALAEAARVYRPYDAAFADRCRQAALRAYAWLTATPGLVTPSEDWAAAYDYNDTPGDATEVTLDATARAWAAAEIWATTGDGAALADFEARAQAASYAFNPAPDWNDPSDLGIATYLLSGSAARNPTVVAGLEASVMTAAASLESAYAAPDNGWGRAQGYWWGANGTVARSCLVLAMAARLDAAGGWMDLCAEQIGHLMGRNLYGRSQVTGLGVDPPLHPHHRPSAADGVVPPWPGLLVGGAQQSGAQWIDWTDDQNDFQTNEAAINYSAGLVYAFAAFLGADPGQPAADSGVGALPDGGPSTCPPVSDAGATGDGGADASTTGVHPGGGQGGCGCAVDLDRPARSAAALAGLALLLCRRRRRR
ncbi:MAG TPA: glycoside hydrolase family 9 protein [Polyangia bacterium]|nr:glycoside hydrolase family 9 protein [Polyangia bacterium]